MISPETRPRPSLPAVYSSASKKASWPTVDALPGQTSSNHFLSRSSTQKEKWSHPSSISSSYSSQQLLQDRDGLHADEAADVPADGRDERAGLHEAVHGPLLRVVLEVVAGVEVGEGDARLLARDLRDLDDVLDLLGELLVLADVHAGRAELAVRGGRGVVPVHAGLGEVDAEVGPLQDADAGHRDAPRRRPRVPGGRVGKADRVDDVGEALVADGERLALPDEGEGRDGDEGLVERDVDPDPLAGGGNDQLEAGAEAGAGAGDPAGVHAGAGGVVDEEAPAEELDLELDGVPGRVGAGAHRPILAGSAGRGPGRPVRAPIGQGNPASDIVPGHERGPPPRVDPPPPRQAPRARLPRRVRVLPRRRPGAAAPRGAPARPPLGGEPRRHVDELRRRAQRDPRGEGAEGAGRLGRGEARGRRRRHEGGVRPGAEPARGARAPEAGRPLARDDGVLARLLALHLARVPRRTSSRPRSAGSRCRGSTSSSSTTPSTSCRTPSTGGCRSPRRATRSTSGSAAPSGSSRRRSPRAGSGPTASPRTRSSSRTTRPTPSTSSASSSSPAPASPRSSSR